MQVQRSPQVHEVLIIGSGASGGMAAWNLTRQGVDVLMLDAGTKFQRSQFWTHVKPWQGRQMMLQGKHAPDFYLSNREQPFDTLPGEPFYLARVWGRGGKTNVWGRVSLRYSDLNLTEPDRDGWEVGWPFRYSDIAPYYDKVDQLIGVCGGTDSSEWLPGSQYHLPAPNKRCGEALLQKAGKRIGVNIVSGRRAVLTKAHNGKAPCHYCGACGRGCDVGAFFNSSDYLLEPAFKTGRLKVIDNAVVAQVLVDDKGLASGVQYFDRVTGEEHKIYAKRVIMAASCVDTTRILLNSRSSKYPNGIGNSNDVIGRYLCEQIRFHMYGFVPELMGGPTHNDDGIGGEHIYMPRFTPTSKKDYLRGFGMQFWGCGAVDNAGIAKEIGGFGADFKRDVKRRYPALVALHPYGEVLPYKHNRIVLDHTKKDKFGIPVMKIEYRIGDNERKMAADMYDTAEAILRAAKAEILPFERAKVDMNGSAIHEHGTCRMGRDPKTSALNGYGRSHEVKNLWVVDGSAFPTSTEKNPTLTILAYAWRATDYMSAEMKAGRA